MSQENVELTYRAIDAFERGDLDALCDLFDEDVEISSRLAPFIGPYRGHDGVRRWWQTVHDVFPDWSPEPLEVRDLGDLTFGSMRIRAHGGESGAPIEQVIWQVAEWRAGKIVRLTSHDSEAEALEAAGLSE